MAPKKDPGKEKKSSAAGKDKPKKKKGKGDAAVGDGDKPEQLSPKEMKGHIESLQADKMKEEQERNFVQLERIKCIRDDCELRRKQEVHEVEERKNTHINELMKKHEKAFTEIKCYYNDITQNNLDLIKTLKEDVTDMKKKEAANEKLMYDIAQENKRLTEPLTRALKEVETLKKQLANYEKDKLSLQQSRVALAEHSKQLKNLEFEKGALQQRFDEVRNERDQLYKQFENGMFELQQKSNLKHLLIQRKVQVLEENLEKKDAQIGEVTAMANRDPNVIQHVKENVNHTVDLKNKEIRQLRYELGKMTKAYKDLSIAFKTKLVQYGIPLEEMGLPYYMS